MNVHLPGPFMGFANIAGAAKGPEAKAARAARAAAPLTDVPTPTPNTGPGKYVAMGGGLASGVALASGIRWAQPSAEGADKLRAEGKSMTDEDQLAIYSAAPLFAAGVGIIGLGLARRSPTAGFTTAVGAAMTGVLTGSIGAVAKADSPDGKRQAIGMGVVGASAAAGALYAVRDEVKHVHRVRISSLVLFGMAGGLMAPMAFEFGTKLKELVSEGFQHRSA